MFFIRTLVIFLCAAGDSPRYYVRGWDSMRYYFAVGEILRLYVRKKQRIRYINRGGNLLLIIMLCNRKIICNFVTLTERGAYNLGFWEGNRNIIKAFT